MENNLDHNLKNPDWFDSSKNEEFGLPRDYGRLVGVTYEIKKNLFGKKKLVVEGYQIVGPNELKPHLKITQDYETGENSKQKYLRYDCWS